MLSPTITIIDATVQNGGPAGPTVLSGAISPGLATVGYRIDALAGERLQFHSDTFSSTSGTWEVVGPGQQVIASAPFGTDFQANLATDGYYDLLLIGSNSNPATPITYKIEATNISDMPVNPTGFNTPHAGTLGASGTASFTFAASAGQHIYFDSQVPGGASYSVIDPHSNVVLSTSSSNDRAPFELQSSGTYTVKVTGSSGTAYGFNVLALPTNANALSLSTNTAGTDAAYQSTVYSFQGSPGQRLAYIYELAQYANVYATIYAPDGSTVFSVVNNSINAYVSPFTLTEPGTYELVLDNETAASANYQFKLSDAATLPLTTNATTSGTITPGRGADLYSFSGVAGQQLYIQPVSEGHSAGAAYSLWGPDNNDDVNYTNVDPGNNTAYTLLETGTYVLWVTGNTTANANDAYSLNVDLTTTPVDPLALSTVVSGSLPEPNAQHKYTFTGSVGQTLYFDGLPSAAGLFDNITDPNGNVIVGNNLVTSDYGGIELALPGTYTVTIFGTSGANGSYAFALRDYAAAPALATNTTTTATLATGITTDLYSFTGAVGQRFDLDSLSDGHVNGAYYYLYGPDARLKIQGYNEAGNNQVYTLTQAGTYTLAIAGQNAANATDPYIFIAALTTPDNPPTALTLGATTSGTIAQPGQQHVYGFTGSVGQALYFNGLTSTSGIYAYLYDPSGSNVFIANPASNDNGPFALTKAGAYTLVIQASNNTTTGAYSFALKDLAGATAITPSASGGATIAATLATGITVDTYSFTGTAGDRLSILSSLDQYANAAYYYLYEPSLNTYVTANYTDASRGYNTLTLPQSGNYVLFVVGQSAANASDSYSVQLVETPVTTAALTLNATTTGTIAQPAQQRDYTFTGSVGQQLYFNGLASTAGIYAYLYDPSGGNVYINNPTSSDNGPFTLTKAGTYTLLIQASNTTTTGTYSFALRDLSSATAITPSASGGATVSGNLATGITTDLYSFTGTAGDRLSIQSLSDQFSDGAYYYLYEPGLATYVASNYTDAANAFRTLTLPLSGNYVLFVVGQTAANASDSYSLQLTETPVATSALTLGATTTGTLTAPGQQRDYTFTGSVGQQLYFNGLPSTSNIYAYLYDPSNSLVFVNNPASTDNGPFTLTKAGTYTLIVGAYNNGVTTGPYSFALRDLSMATAITPSASGGATISATLTTGITTDLYSFTGTAGDRLSIQSLSDQFTAGAYYYLYEPGLGTYVAQNYTDSGNGNRAVTLPLSGTYVLLVVGQTAANASDMYGLQLIENPVTTTALTLNAATSGSITQPAGEVSYTFTGSPEQTLYFDGLSTVAGFGAYLYDPSGNNVYFGNTSTTGDYGPFTLTKAGTYTLSILASNGVQTGGFSFALRDYASATGIAPSAAGGATISGNLATGNTTDLYAFAGTAGDQLAILSQSDQYANGAYYYLYEPSLGVPAQNYTDANYGSRVVTLSQTGNYVLVVAGQNGANASDMYGLKLIETTPTTTASLALNTPVTDSLAQPGSVRKYTFTGSVGQTLLFDGLSGPASVYAQLLDPTGANVSNVLVTSDSAPVTLTRAGTYTLTVSGEGSAASGIYSFELLDASTKQLTPGTSAVTTNGTLNPGTMAAVYEFSGTAGQTVLFKSDSFSPSNGSWYLYDANNNQVAGTSFGNNLTATLATNGTYKLVLFGNATSTITYSFDSSATTPTSVTTSGLNAPQSGALAAGATMTYTFAANAGQAIYFANQGSGANINFSLTDPSSGTLFGFTTANYLATLTKSGTYTLTFKNTAGASQNYAFETFAAPSGATTLTLGQVTPGSLAAGAVALYQFSGTAGQTIFFDGQSVNSNVQAYLTSPTLGYLINGLNTQSDSSTLTLPATGSYLLAIYAPSTASNYQFRVIDPSTTPLTTTGSTTSGTLASGLAANLYSFTATAGQRFGLTSLTESIGSGAYYRLYDPYNGQPIGGYLASNYDTATTLAYTGTYVLAIEGQSSSNASVAYSFQANLTTPNSPPDALTLNATTTGTLAHPGAEHFYTFTGTAGHVLFFDGQSPTYSPGLGAMLYDPSGSVIGVNTDTASDQGPFLLAASGTYTLIISSTSASSGPYSFDLRDFASSTALTLGATTSGTLATGLSDDVYSFTGTAGQRAFIKGLSDAHANGAYITLYNPQGVSLGSNYAETANGIAATLTQTGTYTVVVAGQTAANATDGYSFVAYESTPNSPPDALTLNATTTGTIAVPGGEHFYTFTGTAGHTLYFDGQSPQLSPPIYTYLYDPFGNAIGAVNTIPTYSDGGPFTLTATGTYTLEIYTYSNEAASGAYSFDLHDFASSTPLPLNAVTSGTLATGLSDDVYSFTGAPGQRLFIQGLADSNSGGAIYTLYDPRGVSVINNYTDLNYNQVANLTQAGTYTLVVAGQTAANATDGYSLGVYVSTPTSPPDHLTLNATTTGLIAQPGQQHTYSFAGTAGQMLYFDGQSPQLSPPLYAYLYDPFGNVVGGLNTIATYNDSGPFTLTATGTYTLIISANSTSPTTGAYSFDLHDLASSTALTLNAVTSGTLATGLSDDVYSFTGAPGQRLFIQGLADAHTSGAYFTLYDPRGVNVTAYYTDPGYNEVANLTLAGTYTLVVAGQSAANSTDGYSLGVYVSTLNSPPDALTLNATTTGTIAQPGQQHAYSFTGTAGHVLFFDGQSPQLGSALYAYLYDPFGNVVGGLNQIVTSNDSGPFTLATTGTFTLVITAYSNTPATGAYSFDLHDFASSTALTLNAATSGTLATGLSDDVYSFTGAPGQRVYIQGLADAHANGAYADLYDPRGVDLTGSYTDPGYNQLVTLTQAGTYTLVVSGRSAANATDGYSVGVYDSTPDSPPIALTLGSTTTGTIAVPGQQRVYSFTGTPGQELFFDGLPSAAGLYAYLDDPFGTNVNINNPTTSDNGPFVLTKAGTYTLVVRASDNLETGAYSFALRDYAGSTPLVTNTTLSGTLATGLTTDLYSFSGTAGQQVYITSLGDSHANGAYYYLYRPDFQTYIASNYTDSNYGSNQFTLPFTGTYYLEVVGQSAANATDGYSLEVYQSTTTTTALTLDANTSGTIARPGAQASYTFTGTAGQALLFDGRGEPAGAQIYATLTDPNGNAVSQVNGMSLNSDTDPIFDLLAGGTYTLTVFSNSGTTGAYAFDLHSVAGATPLATNTPLNGTLGTGLATDVYTFGGTAGQQLYIQGLSDGHSGGAYYVLYGPDNQRLAATYAENSSKPALLTMTGTYTLAVFGQSAANATDPYGLEVFQSNVVTTPLTFNATTSGTINRPGDTDTYTFTGTVGQRLYYDGQSSPAGNVIVQLYDPNGRNIANYALNGDTLLAPLALSGTYQVVVDASDTSTGGYAFQFIDEATLTEAEISATEANVQVILSAASAVPVTVQYTTQDDTATEPTDYLPTSGTLTFAPGQTIATIPVQIVATAIPQHPVNKDFFVDLSNPTNATIARAQGVVTIEEGPLLTITNVTGTAPNAGTTNFSFIVSLSSPSLNAVTVAYATMNGSASAPGDYVAASGTVTFPAGATSETINVTVNGSNAGGPNKTFTVVLSSPTYSQLGAAAVGTGTIQYPTATGSVAGEVYNDLNGDGTLGAGEGGVANVTVELLNGSTVAYTTQTAANGTYSFPTVVPGLYTLAEVLPSGYIETAPGASGTYAVNVTSNGTITAQNFGDFKTVSIAGEVFNDLNANGVLDAGEPGIQNWNVQLLKGGAFYTSVNTDANGNYSFSNLGPGTFTVQQVLQGGYFQTAPASPGTYTVTTSSGTNVASDLFGVTQKTLVSIAVTPANPSIAKGLTEQFTATGMYNDGTTLVLTSQVTWASATPTVATIGAASGLASGVGIGTSTITATDGGVVGSTTLTVTAAALVSIAVTPANPSIAKGLTEPFAATGSYTDGTTANLTGSVTWASASPTVATINASGVATGVGVGGSTITATSGSVVGSTTLTVTAAQLVSIAVTPANPSIAKGLTEQFTATGTYTDTSTANLTGSVTWASATTTVATIGAATGLASAVGVGGSTITATSGSVVGSTTLTVTAAQLVSIAVTPVNPVIAKGSTEPFVATGTYTDNTTQDLTSQVTWASAIPAVATIGSTTGLATGVGVGSSTITATDGGVVGSTTLTVTAANLVSISVTPTNPSIAKGLTEQFTATGLYSDNSTANLTGSVTWASATPTVATIDVASGLASGVGIGTSTITATDGGVVGSTTLTVTAAQLVSIAVTPANPSIAKGLTEPFAATGTYTDGTTQPLTGSVVWASASPTVATINASTGLASGVGVGTSTITATSGSVVGSTTLTVSPAALVSIAVTPANPSIAKGLTEQFAATGSYTDGTTATLTGSVTWASLTTSVATIGSTTGLATGVGVGTSTITATSGSVVGSTTLTVTAAQLVSIAISPVATSVTQGGTVQFTATGTYTDASTADVTGQVTWSSTTTTVATISNAAGSQGLASAVGVGTTTIQASLNGVTSSTSLTVTAQVLATIGTVSVSWGSAGTSALQTAADGLRLLPATRSNDLPWYGINQISITLSQAEALSAGDVTVSGLVGVNYGPVAISGSGTNYVITLAQPIDKADRLTITIGNANIATYTRRLDVLPGDVNDDGVVNLQDAIIERNGYLGFASVPVPLIFLDILGDGAPDLNNYNLIRKLLGTKLP